MRKHVTEQYFSALLGLVEAVHPAVIGGSFSRQEEAVFTSKSGKELKCSYYETYGDNLQALVASMLNCEEGWFE